MKHAGHGSVGKRGRLLGLLVGVGVGIGVPGGGWWAEGIEHDSTHLSIVDWNSEGGFWGWLQDVLQRGMKQ